MNPLLRFLLALLSIVLLTIPARAQPGPAQPRDALEERVNRALKFLKSMQTKEGAWPGPGSGVGSPPVTGLAVMAFLSAGHVPGEGPYGDVVEKGIRWLLSRQNNAGLFDDLYPMYTQGICTLMLANAAGMTDAKLGEDCRRGLERAVKVILRAQATQGAARGGWRYMPDGKDADLSVTGWQLLALRAAKNTGCDVPAEVIDRAVQYVRNCAHPSMPGFCYMPGSFPSIACTGTGVLCLEICAPQRPRGRDLLEAGAALLRDGVNWNNPHISYSIYYGAQASFQLGNNYRNAYRPLLHKALFDRQESNGAWINREGHGPVYATAMAVLALTVEYRFLPIYQRHEEQPKG